jgi:hypothetical protein
MKFFRAAWYVNVVCCATFCLTAYAADPAGIHFDSSAAKPRTMEDLTRTAIARDYARGWDTLTQAYEAGSPAVLDAYFIGSARKDLGSSVEHQQKLGLQTHYQCREHHVKVVFYAPEGDLAELQDTANCQVQALDGKKIIDDQNVVLHYVVLMTPAADRWLIRQMQAVSQF